MAETLSASRNKVVISSKDGNVEKPSGLSVSKATSRISNATAKLVSSRISSNAGGIGVNNTSNMPMTAIVSIRSPLSETRLDHSDFMA